MKKGFTLIELVIVIGILAILAAAVVLVLNPAQLLAQARDSQRISDLGSVKSAIALYLATAASPAFVSAGPVFTSFSPAACPFTTCAGATVTNSTVVTGAGWVKIDLTTTSGGSALGSLPMDPSNGTTYEYGYKGDISLLTFKLVGILESTKYAPLMSGDGGTSTAWYEIGTKLDL